MSIVHSDSSYFGVKARDRDREEILRMEVLEIF